MPLPDDNYNFLNSYIDRIISNSSQVDDKPVEDDNDDFFSTSSDEDQTDEDNGISYNLINDDDFGFQKANQELRESGDPIDDEGNPLSDDDSQPNDQPNDQNFAGPGGMTPDEETDDTVFGTGHTGSFYDEMPKANPEYITSLGGEEENPGLKKKIAHNESRGSKNPYKAYNSAGGGTGAVGKYQFRWNIWKDSIKQVTGAKTQQQFLHSPKAQELYFNWYNKNYLSPVADKLKPYNKAGLSKDQLAELIHFRGEAGAKKYLQGQVPDKPEAYNSSISDYIGLKGIKQTGGNVESFNPNLANNDIGFQAWYKKNTIEGKNNQPYSEQGDYDYYSFYKNGEAAKYKGGHFPDTYKRPNHETFSNESIYSIPENPGGRWRGNKYLPARQIGGPVVASTPAEQYHGLNNGSFNQMIFPMDGVNEFRGLDNGMPVYLEDETGKKKVLKGPKHKAKMKGRVFETRLNR